MDSKVPDKKVPIKKGLVRIEGISTLRPFLRPHRQLATWPFEQLAQSEKMHNCNSVIDKKETHNWGPFKEGRPRHTQRISHPGNGSNTLIGFQPWIAGDSSPEVESTGETFDCPIFSLHEFGSIASLIAFLVYQIIGHSLQ